MLLKIKVKIHAGFQEGITIAVATG